MPGRDRKAKGIWGAGEGGAVVVKVGGAQQRDSLNRVSWRAAWLCLALAWMWEVV